MIRVYGVGGSSAAAFDGNLTAPASTALTITGMAATSSGPSVKLIAGTAMASGQDVVSIYNGANLLMQANYHSSYTYLKFHNGSSGTLNGGWLGYNSGGHMVLSTFTNLYSFNDLQTNLGTTTSRWIKVAARQYEGITQTVASSGTPAFSAASGEMMRIVLNANITSWTVTNPLSASIITILFVQSSGGHTLSAPPANVKLVGGGMTLSAGAGAVDSLTLRYDLGATTWYEIGRGLNLS